MKLKQLLYIVHLADTLHFKTAAKRCHVSQSTLSTQLQQLEKYLGVTLFDRSLRSVKLTEIGKQIIPHARTILEVAETIKDIAQDTVDPLAKNIHL